MLAIVRSLLACCVALLYLSPARVDSMTVSPILYFTTEGPSQYNRYYEAGDHSKSYYGNGSPSSAYGYGHRSMPDSSAYGVGKARRSREEQQQQGYAQPYETPHTYEYMSNPSRKTSEASRVPGTERRPPGGDVELIGDGPQRSKEHVHRIKKRKKKIRKQARPSEDYGGDGRAAEPEVGSSSKNNVRKGAVPAVRDDERVESVGGGEKRTPQQQQRKKKNGQRDREEIDEDYAALDARTKHNIHKKNEYSKRQQFFDEEHVDTGKKKPAGSAAAQGSRNKKVHKKREDVQRVAVKRKRRAKKGQDKKPVVQQDKHPGHGGGGGAKLQLRPGSSQGYGHMLAVR